MKIDYLADYPELIPELAELHHAEWSHFDSYGGVSHRIDNLKQSCGRGGVPTALVAIDGDVLVGSALLDNDDMSTRCDLWPWLAAVFVKPAYRRLGVATRLVARVEVLARALAIERIYLFTDSEASFYTRRGWAVEEECEYKAERVTIMSKSITGTVSS